jgi:hypothetical protein
LTGDDLRKARAVLGRRWGFGRPVHAAELGRALRMAPSDPGDSIRAYEAKRTERIPGLLDAAVTMLLNGAMPPDSLDEVRRVHFGGRTATRGGLRSG